jgi:hypothetical protein
MNSSTPKKLNRFLDGLDFLVYALEVFGILGLELVLVNLIEPKIFGDRTQAWQTIVHWIVTCAVWGGGAYLVVKDCAKKKSVDLIADLKDSVLVDKSIKAWQWVLIAVGVITRLISSWIDWNGSKVLAEFRSRGPLLFPFQYIYYLFEVVLILLIIIFGQTAFEKWFRNADIPYGGILCALTWGLAHRASKGTLATGIYAAVGGFVFGASYLLTRRNVKLSYVLLCIMFIL